jgi:VWFA-related protein
LIKQPVFLCIVLDLVLFSFCWMPFTAEPHTLPDQTPDNKEPFTIKVATRLVLQAVTVRDKDGKPIEGLSGRDFIVTEDGVRQTVSICEFQKFNDTPLPPIRPQSILKEEASPILQIGRNYVSAGQPGEIKYQDRRLLILYFDLMTMRDADQYRAFDAGRKFIQNQMAQPDLMAIMVFSRSVVRTLMDFTDDREKLDQAIQTLMYRNSKSESDVDADLSAPDTAAAFGQNSSEFNLFNTNRQLAALQTAVRMLGVLSERKSLVYFASGLPMYGMDNQSQLRATINAAIRANVMLYPVDARGLVAFAPIGDATRPSPGGIAMFSGAAAMSTLSSFQQSQDTLYSLGADTGGKALLDYNDLSRGIVTAQQAVSSYYIIGYYTTNNAVDGKFRRVKIELADGQSAKLDYRQGYYAAKQFAKFTEADKERQLEEALMLGDPITDLTIAMELNYFKLNSAEYFVPVTIKIPGSELVLAKNTGSDRTLIDFIGEIRDDYGTTYSNLRDKVSFKLKGETASALLKSTIEFDCGFTLLPGKYIIKVLARDAETGRIGTFQTTFTIPNLMKENPRVPVSSVVLSSQRVDMRQALYTAGKDKKQTANPLVIDGQKLIPSVTRVFKRERPVYVYLQAYENQAAATEPLVAFVTLFRGQVKVFETPAFEVKDGVNPRSKAVELKFSLALDKLPAGEYKCQVTVLDPTGKKASFWQSPIMLI